MNQIKEPQTEPQPQIKDCEEKDTPTQKSINSERDKYCDQLYESAGEVAKWEESYKEHKKLNKQKRCLFLKVEENYRILRNFNITVGSEFTQTNETIKNNITEYISRNTELADTLKSIAAEVKSLKAKMLELRDQACKLEACRDDSCNTIQWNLLTGKPENKGNRTQSRTQKLPDCTTNCEEFFNKLICMPKALNSDVDSIFKVTAEIKGIHVFSNLSSLESMRSDLANSAQQLNNHLQSKMQLRESDLKTIQEELIQIIKESAKSNVSRYNARSNFNGLNNAVDFMCCPDKDYDCVQNSDCEPRLKGCEEKICMICNDVRKIYCPERSRQPHDQSVQSEINK